MGAASQEHDDMEHAATAAPMLAGLCTPQAEAHQQGLHGQQGCLAIRACGCCSSSTGLRQEGQHDA